MLFDCFSMPLTSNIWFLWIAIIAYHRYQFIIFVPPSLCHRQFQEVIEVIETFEAEMDALTWEVPCAAPLLELKEWNVPAPSKARETLEACYSQKSCDRSSAMTKCIQLSFVGICRFKKPITSESRMKGIQLGRNVCFCSTVLLFLWSIRFFWSDGLRKKPKVCGGTFLHLTWQGQEVTCVLASFTYLCSSASGHRGFVRWMASRRREA